MIMSEAAERQLQAKAEAVKEHLGNTGGVKPEIQLVEQLAFYYYHMRAQYARKRVTTKATESLRRQEFWGRVSVCCKAAGVSPERYMKAQFSYFHTAFGTTPKLSQLATKAATERAKLYGGKTSGNVVSNAIETKVELGAIFARCEQQIRDICRHQKISREEYYRKFVLSGLVNMPKEFLNADPTYQQVTNELRDGTIRRV
jgi:hypothetical protein